MQNLLIRNKLDKIFLALLMIFAALFPYGLVYIVIILGLFLWFVKLYRKELLFDTNFLYYSILLVLFSHLISFIMNYSNIRSNSIYPELVIVQYALKYVTPFIWFFVVSSISISEAQVKQFFNIFGIFVIITIIYGLIFKVPYLQPQQRLILYNANPNPTGELIAMVCTALFVLIGSEKKNSRIIFKSFLLLISLVALFFTYSRAAWLGLIGSLIWIAFWGLKNHTIRRIIIITVIFSLLVFIFTSSLRERFHSIIEPESSESRVQIWETAAKIVDLNPWFQFGPNKVVGIGPYMFGTYYHQLNPNLKIMRNAHNNFLDWLVGQGLFGLLCFLIVQIALFYTAFRLQKETTGYLNSLVVILIGWLISWNINGMFCNSLQWNTSLMYMCLFGLISSVKKQNRHPKNQV